MVGTVDETVRRPSRAVTPALAGVAGLLACVLWAHWPSLARMAHKWSIDPRYSHGYLVPLFAAFLLWRRWPAGPMRFSPWGLALIAAGEALHLAGAHFYVEWAESMALLPTLAGVALLAGGWPALRWALPSVGFLAFMVPLPYRVETALGPHLQRGATAVSTYALQTLGFPAVAEGNVILLGENKIKVVDACSGLSILLAFFAISTAVALLLDRRPWMDRAAVVLSAVPIALAANVARIIVTGTLYELSGGRLAHIIYHDLAGWLMLPLAMGMLWAELWALDRLLVEVAPADPLAHLVLGGRETPAASAAR